MSRSDLILPRTQFTGWSLCLLWLVVPGCGYTVGAPYNPEVRTVYVPIFQTESTRRGYEYELTEAVQEKIKSRSAFRLASEEDADTKLTGRIVSANKKLLGINGYSDARELQLDMTVEITWTDQRTGDLLGTQRIPAPEMVSLTEGASFAPEVGQSLATAKSQAIDRLSTRIVQMMESPW